MLTVDALNREWLSAERVIVLIATGRLLTHSEIEASALAGMEYGVRVGPGDAREWDAAVDVLAAAVLAEKLAAWGRRAKAFGDPDHAAPLEQIPAGHFARLRAMVSNWTHPRDPRDRGPAWWQVGFKRREVVKLWPPAMPDGKGGPPIAPKALSDWFAGYVKRHQLAGTIPTREEDRRAVAAAFPQHKPPSRATLRDLRAGKDTPPEWRKQGRRPAPKTKRAGNS